MMFGQNPGTNGTANEIPLASIGAELGVWKGDSSAKFLDRAIHIHLVDSWSPVAYEESDEWGDYDAYLDRYSKLVGSNDPKAFIKYYDKIYEDVVKRFSNKPVTIHRMTTNEWFESFDKQLDWIYVDASHSYDGVLNDLRRSWKLIKIGGVLFGDDFSDKKAAVKKAVKDFSAEIGVPIDNFYMDQFRIKKLI